jgi:hypothetical protein
MELDMQSSNLNIAGRWKQWMVPLGLCLLLWGGALVLGGESEDSGGVLRSRVYNLRHISSEQARDLFSQLNIGKSYNTLTPDMLIITSNVGSDLVMATEIIGVLDQTPPVQVRTLMVASDSQPLPPLDEFIAMLGSISAGTLTEAPAKGAQKPAIIDVLGDELIAIAAEDELEEIERAVEDWKKKHPASNSESQEAPGPAPGQVSEKPLEASSSQVKLKAAQSGEEAAEPNVPQLAPEPNDLPEPEVEASASVEPVVAEELPPALDTELQQPSQKPLEEVAEQVFEAPSITDADEPSAEAATAQADVSPAKELDESMDGEALEEVEEDFLSEGLLQELADAQQEANIEQMPDEATVAEASEEVELEQSDDTLSTPAAEEIVQKSPEELEDPMKTMRALLAQARAQDEEAAITEETVQEAVQEVQAKEEPKQVSLPGLNAVPTPEPVEETDTLQAELALLRQRLAELEAKAV